MPVDTGTAVIIASVLIFYLRLIILQRERAKRFRRSNAVKRAGESGKARTMEAQRQLTLLSQNRRDWVIAALGVAAILAGVLLNRNILPGAAFQAYWWLPLALGIVAFSWAFR